ncbi:MAG: hypothetical protein NVSMB62_17500 [Acidobacteriaceae bacterium]
MDSDAHSSPSKQNASVLLAGSTLMFLTAGWILLVAGTRLHEMVVGAAAVVACAAFLWFVHRHSTLRVSFQLMDVLTGWRIPWYILSDSYTVIDVLVRDCVTSRRADSLYRVSGFATSRSDPTLAARRVLATVYSTATPSSIVIGVDYSQSRLLIHQLRRSEMSLMMRELGAKL